MTLLQWDKKMLIYFCSNVPHIPCQSYTSKLGTPFPPLSLFLLSSPLPLNGLQFRKGVGGGTQMSMMLLY